jgi:hypothetical protein
MTRLDAILGKMQDCISPWRYVYRPYGEMQSWRETRTPLRNESRENPKILEYFLHFNKLIINGLGNVDIFF